ncbi:MAG: contractile injection system tape measure protein [Saprospiraceae bacterium]
MSNHFIKTLSLDLTANSEKEGFKFQQEFSELVRTKLSQKMEDIFDEFGKDQDIRIENLELEVQGVEAENWEEDFMEKFSQQLIKKLKELKLNSTSFPSSTNPTSLTRWESFLFFLKNGFFPWHENDLTINTLDNFVIKEIESNQALILLVKKIKNDSIAMQRLINHLQISTLDTIFDRLCRGEVSFIPFYEVLEKTYSKKWDRTKIKLEIWTIAFQSLLRNPPERVGIKRFKNKLHLEVITKSFFYFSRKKIITQTSQKKDYLLFEELKANFIQSNLVLSDSVKNLFQQNEIHQKSFSKEEISPKTNHQSSTLEPNNSSMDEIIKEGIFIPNAGLVLLHPYIQMLFDKMELTENKNFKGETDQNQAALVLQYLATGKFSFMEHELAFNKILCNIPIENPIATELTLNEDQIELCDGLLNAIIGHWKILGETSIAALRETFIQRNGKLSIKENGDWSLQVESKSLDILLDSLPWTISVMKLPWMEKMITVNWR